MLFTKSLLPPILPYLSPSLSLSLSLSLFPSPSLPLSLSLSLSHTAAVRFCRKIVGLRDEFYNRYIVRNNLLAPIVKFFVAQGQRYNLLNSAIIELFEYIHKVQKVGGVEGVPMEGAMFCPDPVSMLCHKMGL